MREWIVTNGLGGYASLTHESNNTSKFHGLLIAGLNPPTKRWVFVSNMIDKIKIDDKEYDLTNYEPNFDFDYFPSFTYRIDDATIKKTILMPHGKNTTIIRYQIKNRKSINISHGPIVHSRHFYDLNSQRYLFFEQEKKGNVLFIKPENTDRTLKIILKNSEYEEKNYWETMYYEKDRKRNDSWIDNAVHTGYFHKKIKKPSVYYLALTVEDNFNFNPALVFSKEKERKEKLIEKSNLSEKFKKLVLSTDNFIVKKGEGKSVIAGYPWFGDWGRDALISLPGLTLVTRRFNEAKEILNTFAKYRKNSLIPNFFSDRESEAAYNSVDASLWFIDRVYQYMRYTNDTEFLEKMWECLEDIISGYKNGTIYDIGMDEDYLISHGPGLTWMDVKIGDFYPTPRFRKAVEIQGLWYNALKIMSDFSEQIGKEDNYFDLSESVKESFNEKYDLLYDVIDTHDFSLRPNIIFLVSLDNNMIEKTRQKEIIKVVQDNLLTIFGLRTLSPHDQNYKGTYIGNYNRDIAYHSGTVWPWLLGSFIKGYVKVNNYSKKNREYAYEKFLKPMIDVYGEKWDGSIHEIFDGDPVYTPRGCISQAWSVAEILRSWVEDIENKRPKYEKNSLHKIRV